VLIDEETCEPWILNSFLGIGNIYIEFNSFCIIIQKFDLWIRNCSKGLNSRRRKNEFLNLEFHTRLWYHGQNVF